MNEHDAVVRHIWFEWEIKSQFTIISAFNFIDILNDLEHVICIYLFCICFKLLSNCLYQWNYMQLLERLSMHIHVSRLRFITAWLHNIRATMWVMWPMLTHYQDSLTATFRNTKCTLLCQTKCCAKESGSSVRRPVSGLFISLSDKWNWSMILISNFGRRMPDSTRGRDKRRNMPLSSFSSPLWIFLPSMKASSH